MFGSDPCQLCAHLTPRKAPYITLRSFSIVDLQSPGFMAKAGYPHSQMVE